MTGRQRWEVGEPLVDASEAIICSFHTSFKQFSFSHICQKLFFFKYSFLPLFHPYITIKSAGLRFCCVFFFFWLVCCQSKKTNAVQQGDIEHASLKQENKHCCGLSYTVTKGKVSFPCTEHLHQCK